MFPREICEICWNTFFAEHHRTTATDCSSINSNERKIGKQNRKLLKRAVQVKNSFQKQSFADFKLGVLKNFLSFTRKHLWKVCNSINNRLQHSRFPVKFANVLRTPFLQSSFSGYLWGLTRVFKGVQNKEQKPVRLSAINTIFKLQKCICCHKNSEAATVGVS